MRVALPDTAPFTNVDPENPNNRRMIIKPSVRAVVLPICINIKARAQRHLSDPQSILRTRVETAVPDSSAIDQGCTREAKQPADDESGHRSGPSPDHRHQHLGWPARPDYTHSGPHSGYNLSVRCRHTLNRIG